MIGGLVAVMLVAGCGGGSLSGATADPTVPSTPTTAPTTPTPAKTPTTTHVAARKTLAGVGISDLLANRFVSLANRLGYGPADKSFAWVMVGACRDVKAGSTSFAELAAQDISGGAPRKDAEHMYSWLKTNFCPHVRAATDQTQPKGHGPGTPPTGLQALGSSVSVFDAQYQAASQAPCRAAEGVPLGKARAYRLSSNATICLDYIERAPLGDVQDSLALVYATPVSQATAMNDLHTLLPTDVKIVNQLTGHNPPYAPNKSGSCLSVLYTSANWHSQMSQYDSSDSAGITYGTSLNAVLYSARQTSDGSSSAFNGTVRFVDLTSGGHNFAYKSKTVTC